MADQNWNGLPYGNFGNAFYQAEEQTWRFEKIPNQSRVLQQLGDSKTVAPSPGLPNVTATSEPPHVRQRKQVDEIIRDNPRFQPATSLLGPLLRTSEAVLGASQRHDPVKGSLLSFGRVFDERTRRSTQIVAFATGPTGSDVRIVQVQLQKQGWNDSKDVWLEMPVVAGEEMTWRVEGSPILQVSFAQPLESGENLLAVRTSCRTLIFKPLMKKSAPARLQLRLLIELATTEQGTADVAFNPWFPRQFAVLDQAAQWKIWEFSNRESSDVTCIRSSVIDDDDTRSTGLNDGWARISWIYNPNTVLVATRHSMSLYDVSSDPSKLQDLNLNVSDVSGWILDFATVPADPTRAVVLTTTHIQLVLVDERNGDPQARSVMRIRHFHNPEDVSLRLTLSLNSSMLTVIMRSALNSTLMAYVLDLEESQNPTLYDPARFQLRLTPDETLHNAKVSEIHFQLVSVAEKRSADVGNTLADHLRAGDCRFISLIALTDTLTVSSMLYLDRPTESHANEACAPTWSGRLVGTTPSIKDEFVTDEPPLASEVFDQMNEPVAAYIKQRREHAKRLPGLQWTLQHERTARKIDQRSPLSSNIMATLDQVRELLEQPVETDAAVTKTALELSDGELTIHDMGLASTEMKQLPTMSKSPSFQPSDELNDAPTRGMKFALVPTFVHPRWQNPSPLANTLSSTYDSIVSYWISPLPKSIPGRIRLAKEQLARRLAADVTLASHILRPEEITDPTETQQDPGSQTWDLPMRGAEPSQASQFSAPIASHSALPTPSPTGTPSVTTASSRTSAYSSAEVSRLRKYATFTKPAPSSLPRSLTKILSHWTPGADPSTYDWITTSRQITQQTQEEEADSQLTEKQRARLHRKAERHIRRQRKEAAASQQQHLASSQMPELIVSASQPQFGGGRSESQRLPGPPMGFAGLAGSSQSVAPALGAASQGVAGRFGGGGMRPPVKKKRKQGF